MQFSVRREDGKEGKRGKRTFEREVDTDLFAGHFHFPPFPFFLLTLKPGVARSALTPGPSPRGRGENHITA
jgi:hypothetical protein